METKLPKYLAVRSKYATAVHPDGLWDIIRLEDEAHVGYLTEETAKELLFDDVPIGKGD